MSLAEQSLNLLYLTQLQATYDNLVSESVSTRLAGCNYLISNFLPQKI